MDIKDRLIGRLGGVTEAQASERVSRAEEAAYEDKGEDEPVSGTLRRQGYRTLTGTAIRDLGGVDYAKILDVAWKIYLSNPVAKRSSTIKRDYILGRGLQLQGDGELQAILDGFWGVNKLDARMKKFVLQLFLLGEQMYPVFVKETDGQVRLGYIDPVEIKRVVTHPDNVLEKWAVVLKAREVGTDAWVEPIGERVFRIVRIEEGVGKKEEGETHIGKRVTAQQAILEDWEAAMLKQFGLDKYTGSCFYFSVNDLSNQERGHSDLLQVADWLDQEDAVLFDLADMEQIANFFSFDVTLEGADDNEVKKRAKELRDRPPKKGSVKVHNEKEIWNMHRPDLKQAGSIETAKNLLTYILGGLGLPRHWYGYGDETNRATAQEQSAPTWRSLQTDQDIVRDVILEMLLFARDQAEIAGTYHPKEDDKVLVQMPEMGTRDVEAISRSLNAVATALTMVDVLGLMSRERAMEIWAKVVSELGIEIDPAEEVKKMKEEEGIAEMAEYQLLLKQWRERVNA